MQRRQKPATFLVACKPVLRLGLVVLHHGVQEVKALYHVFGLMLVALKVHKNENFFGFDFEFCTISVIVMSKY